MSTTATTQSQLFATVKPDPKAAREHIALVVRWDWYADTNKYYLSHTCTSEPDHTRLCHAENGFTWKPVDAAGDAGLVVRWIREARTHLWTP